MKRFFISLLSSLFVPALFWTGGFDFDERGFIACYCFLLSVFAFAISYTCPVWEQK